MTLSLYAGIMWILAGCCGLTRHFVMEPKMTTFPKAPPYLHFVYFLTSTYFLFVGLRFAFAWYLGETGIPPNASPSSVALAGVMLNYKATMLINILRQRYPTAVWNRLNNITKTLKCSTDGCGLFKRMK